MSGSDDLHKWARLFDNRTIERRTVDLLLADANIPPSLRKSYKNFHLHPHIPAMAGIGFCTVDGASDSARRYHWKEFRFKKRNDNQLYLVRLFISALTIFKKTFPMPQDDVYLLKLKKIN